MTASARALGIAQIKAGSRQRKIDLINGFNPEWRDLYNDL